MVKRRQHNTRRPRRTAAKSTILGPKPDVKEFVYSGDLFTTEESLETIRSFLNDVVDACLTRQFKHILGHKLSEEEYRSHVLERLNGNLTALERTIRRSYFLEFYKLVSFGALKRKPFQRYLEQEYGMTSEEAGRIILDNFGMNKNTLRVYKDLDNRKNDEIAGLPRRE